jgi:putative ABC transport system permease protein
LQPGLSPLLLSLISADYPRTLGIPLLAGRTLTVAEISRADRVTLINEAAAKLWPEGQNPIGKRVHIDFLERSQGAPLAPGVGGTADVTVVGILRNTRNAGLRNPPAPAAFLPYTVTAPTGRALAIRSQGPNPLSLLGSLREHMRQLDPELPLNRPISMTDVIGENTKQPRFNMALFSFFGGLGLSLAVIGLSACFLISWFAALTKSAYEWLSAPIAYTS